MNARARGMSRDGVQFLVNGERPTANARFALTEVGRMPSGELERVEILRGGSAEFGGAAPVTVNLVMRRPVARAAASVKLAVLVDRGGRELPVCADVAAARLTLPAEQSLELAQGDDGRLCFVVEQRA